MGNLKHISFDYFCSHQCTIIYTFTYISKIFKTASINIMYIIRAFLLAYTAITLASPLATPSTEVAIPLSTPSVEEASIEPFKFLEEEASIESSNATLVPRLNPHQCPANRKHTITHKVYIMAMYEFCDRHTPYTIMKGAPPLVYTYDLTAFDKKPIRWIFKVSIYDNTPKNSPGYGFVMTNAFCKQKFRGFIQGKAGGIPKAYCTWWDNKWRTETLVLGGLYKESMGSHIGKQPIWGSYVWETRKRHGG